MKKVRIKSAVPIYLAAAIWLLVGLIRPGFLLQVGTLILTAALSAAAYLIGSKVFPGKEIEVRERPDTGNAELNRQIEEGRSQLDRLQTYNDALPDPVISAQLDRMTRAGNAILTELEKNPSHMNEVRRFMNYFLPTAEKLMSSYVTFAQSPVKGENVIAAMKSVENSLNMVADAFEKQCDSLYRDQSFDIEADVKVLETLLKSEGLAGGGDFAASAKSANEKNQSQSTSF
ncbi:MAG: 5-bromo-4-chloroindolyl phosphate hydrolysis family protein [Candidatus Faecivicinus sp.]